MSIEAMSHVLGTTVGDTTRKLVLFGLSNHSDKDGEDAWPSVETLAAYAECSTRTVQRALSSLLDDGFIREGDQDVPRAKIKDPARKKYAPINYDVAMSEAQRRVWRDERASGVTPSVRDVASAAGRRGAAATNAGVTDCRPSIEEARGDTGDTGGATPVTGRGDTGVAQTVLEPSSEPSNPATASPAAPETVDAVIVEDVDPAAERRKVTNAIVTGWVNWHATHGPVLEAGRTHQMLCKSFVLPAMESGYTEDQVKQALRDGAEIVPNKQKWRAALLRAAGGKAPQPVMNDRTAQTADFLAQRRAARANGGTST